METTTCLLIQTMPTPNAWVDAAQFADDEDGERQAKSILASRPHRAAWRLVRRVSVVTPLEAS